MVFSLTWRFIADFLGPIMFDCRRASLHKVSSQKLRFLPWELHVTEHDQNLLEPFGMFIQYHVINYYRWNCRVHFLVVLSPDPRVTSWRFRHNLAHWLGFMMFHKLSSNAPPKKKTMGNHDHTNLSVHTFPWFHTAGHRSSGFIWSCLTKVTLQWLRWLCSSSFFPLNGHDWQV